MVAPARNRWHNGPMRYIGIDYGDKKVGVAISNEMGTMAFPHAVLKNDVTFRPAIMTLIKEHEAQVVLGDSRAHDGTPNPIDAAIRTFASYLESEGVTVHFEPEHYSSKEAERIQGRTALTDASAAAILLTSYLNRHSHNL